MSDSLEEIWRRRLEKHLGRMVTDREWRLARKEIVKRIEVDLEMGEFDGLQFPSQVGERR